MSKLLQTYGLCAIKSTCASPRYKTFGLSCLLGNIRIHYTERIDYLHIQYAKDYWDNIWYVRFMLQTTHMLLRILLENILYWLIMQNFNLRKYIGLQAVVLIA